MSQLQPLHWLSVCGDSVETFLYVSLVFTCTHWSVMVRAVGKSLCFWRVYFRSFQGAGEGLEM